MGEKKRRSAERANAKAVEPPATLFHFTGRPFMRGIALYGLTVGELPIDFDDIVVGVSLTSSTTPHGHGLPLWKTACRLTIDTGLIDRRQLVKWTVWAPRHVTPRMRRGLHREAASFNSWWAYVGCIPPEAIVAVDMSSGETLPRWRDWPASPDDHPAIPPDDEARAAWRLETLRNGQLWAALMRSGLVDRDCLI
jgi:hypothetical protein